MSAISTRVSSETERPSRLRIALIELIAALAAAWTWYAASHSIAPPEFEQTPGTRDANAVRRALRNEPLSASALRDLAIASGGIDRPDPSLLQLSDQVSRRDYYAQLYLLEGSAQRGDTAAALRYYDVVLATAPATRGDLFRVLTGAMGNAEVRNALLTYADRLWFADLLETASRQPGRAAIALELSKRSGLLARPEIRDRLTPRLISALLADGEANSAFQLAGTLALSDVGEISFGPNERDQRLGPFAWRLSESRSQASHWQEPEALVIAVEPGRRVEIVTRVTGLGPGRYLFSLAMNTPKLPGARTEWRIRCLGGGASLATMAYAAPIGPIVQQEAFTVPQECPIQTWSLRAEAEDALTASHIVLSQLVVRGS